MASFVTVIVLTVLIDVLVAGFSRRCLTAILGSVAGTVVTCLSAWGLTILLKLDGGDLPYVVPLLSQSAMQVDTRSLYIGMMFLGCFYKLRTAHIHSQIDYFKSTAFEHRGYQVFPNIMQITLHRTNHNFSNRCRILIPH